MTTGFGSTFDRATKTLSGCFDRARDLVAMTDPDDIEMLRSSLRRLLDNIATQEEVAKWDHEDSIPRAHLERLGELGVCGLAVAEEYGGVGLSVRTLVMVITELARRSAALASLYIQCASYAGLNIGELGTKEQKARFLPAVAEGKLMFALGLSEPDVGADLASVKTRATLKGDRVIVEGAKRWCSGAEVSDFIYALVRSGRAEDRYRNLSFVIVPRDAPGVSITRTATMGMRGSPTNDVVFDEVEIPVENIIGGPEAWNKAWQQLAGPTLEIEKLQPSAIGVGIAEGAVAEAWEYSQQRSQFGSRICAHQAVRHQLAEAQTKLQACRLMLDHAADLVDRGEPSAVQTSMTKLFVAETVRDITITCQMVMGAYGYAEGFNMERYVRDALVLPIFGGSSAIQKTNIANLLKLPRQ
jgi:alkylation response protein AidB-like acyl-CoA dehydrogenase